MPKAQDDAALYTKSVNRYYKPFCLDSPTSIRDSWSFLPKSKGLEILEVIYFPRLQRLLESIS
jgi:hypothetical protein